MTLWLYLDSGHKLKTYGFLLNDDGSRVVFSNALVVRPGLKTQCFSACIACQALTVFKTSGAAVLVVGGWGGGH